MRTDSGKFQKAEIVRRTDYAEDLWVIRVRPEHKLVFKPGQYVTLGIDQPEHLMERAYSISSSPLEDEVEFFIELVTDGGLTPMLHKMTVGDWLWMRRQTKRAFYAGPQEWPPPALSGLHSDGCRPLRQHGAHTRPRGGGWEGSWGAIGGVASRQPVVGVCLSGRLEALAQRWSWLRYIPTISRPWEDPEWRGEVGRAEDLLRKYIDSLDSSPRIPPLTSAGTRK